MVRFGGAPPVDGGGYSSADFYSASRSAVYPVFHPKSTRIAGQSKYASPELEAAAQTYADVGKFNLNLFGAGDGQYTTATQPQQIGPQPGAAELMAGLRLPWMAEARGESLAGVPGVAPIVGGGLDFLSNITGRGHQPRPEAIEMFNRLQTTSDDQLTPSEREVKSLNQGLFSQAPDSPLMQGKQISELYKQVVVAEGHRQGGSNRLFAEQTTQPMGFGRSTALGPGLQLYGMASSLLRKFWSGWS